MTEELVKNHSVCRVCLSTCEEKYISLFENYKCYKIFEYINIIVSNVNIQEFDGLPDKICKTCFFCLQTAIDFKDKCVSSNIFLRTQIIKTSMPDRSELKYMLKTEAAEIVLKLENKLTEENYFEALAECDLGPTGNDECELPNTEIINGDFRRNGKLSGSLVIENIGSQVQCHDCGVLFKSKCKLRVHWKKSHMLNSLICSLCKRMFKSYKAMQVHLKRRNPSCVIAADEKLRIEGQGRSRIFHCNDCGYKTHRIKDMAAHFRTHSGERPFQCDECPKKFTQQSSLQTHKECAHKEFIVEITCQFCGKVIKGRNKMYRHLKAHNDERVKCTICKKLVFKRYFKTHMQRHDGVKSFTCEICAAAFYTIAELCNHKRFVHKKGELKKCTKCDFKVIKTDVLKKHLSKHTDKNFPCTICGRFFMTVQKLTTHQKMHYEEKTNPCPLCNKMFLQKDSVRKHISQKHPTFVSGLKMETAKTNAPKQSVTVTMIKVSP